MISGGGRFAVTTITSIFSAAAGFGATFPAAHAELAAPSSSDTPRTTLGNVLTAFLQFVLVTTRDTGEQVRSYTGAQRNFKNSKNALIQPKTSMLIARDGTRTAHR